MNQRTTYLGLTCVLLLAAIAGARDIYVDNVAGDDRHEGRDPSPNASGGPCRTIGRALVLAQSRDRVVLNDTGQPYRECITLHGPRHSGSAETPFVLLGNGAVLDGSRPVPEDAWENVEGDLYRFRPERMSYQQLFLNDRPLRRVPVDNNVLRLPKLEPLEWCLFDRHIYLNLTKPKVGLPSRDSSDIPERNDLENWRYLPQQYNLSYAGHPVGISLFDVRNVVVADLFVQGYQLDGINAHDKAFNASLIGVTARGNGRSGISVGGASRVKVAESLLGNNGAAQLRTEGYSITEVTNCEILAATAPAIVRDGGEVTIDGLQLGVQVYEKDVWPPK